MKRDSHVENAVRIGPTGQIEFIFDDRLGGLLKAGDFEIRRASQVEPDSRGRWVADMGPWGGPRLAPCRCRETALKRERVWIMKNFLGKPRLEGGGDAKIKPKAGRMLGESIRATRSKGAKNKGPGRRGSGGA